MPCFRAHRTATWYEKAPSLVTSSSAMLKSTPPHEIARSLTAEQAVLAPNKALQYLAILDDCVSGILTCHETIWWLRWIARAALSQRGLASHASDKKTGLLPDASDASIRQH